MNNGKKYIFRGLFLNAIGMFIKHLYVFSIILPDFLKGFLEGFFISLGVVFIILGIYRENYSAAKIVNFKKV